MSCRACRTFVTKWDGSSLQVNTAKKLQDFADLVLDTGAPVSTMQTCGECHNTEFIQSHAFHSDLGLSDYKENGGYNSSTGSFGKWDPLSYRFLSQQGDERLDLSTAEWNLQQSEELFKAGAVAERDLRAAQNAVSSSKAQVAAAEAELRSASMGASPTTRP